MGVVEIKDNSMTDKKPIFSRRFSRKEQRIFAFGAFVGWLVIAVTFSTVFKPYLDPLSTYHERVAQVMSVAVALGKSFHHDNFEVEAMTNPSIRNLSNSRSDMYEISGDVRIHGRSFTVFVNSPIDNASGFTLKPYARKFDTFAMGMVSAVTIKPLVSHKNNFENNNGIPVTKPNCDKMPHIPAVVFSVGGYAGNHFHAFTDILLPLYSTSVRFGRDVLLLMLDGPPSWAHKYKNILDQLSKHEVVFVENRENRDRVFCFRRAIVGLKAGREFLADNGRSMLDFTRLVRSAYSLGRGAVKLGFRPRMLVLRRRRGRGRRLVNWGEVADVARGFGFEVAEREMGEDVAEAARLVNGFDVMVGVHGAGLTNMVFLPEGAVVVQIVPYGLHWVARQCFEAPARSMRLRYLAYEAGLNESTLADDKIHLADPAAVSRQGWVAFKAVYLDDQDLRVDLGRFRGTLLKAWELLHEE